MSDNKNDLAYQEVDDELRRERLNLLWKTYGRYIIGAAIMVVVLVAGNEGYRAYVNSARETRAAGFDVALDAAESANALERVDVWQQQLDGLEGPYAILAQFKHAAAAVAVGELETAVAGYDAIARASDAGPLLASLAQFKAGAAILTLGDDLADARSRLSLSARDDAPFRFSAREQLAILDMREGNIDGARAAFSELALADSAPQGVRERARVLRDALVDAVVPEVMPPAPAAANGAAADGEG